MTTNILHDVHHNHGKFPREIILKAIDRKDEIIPELLEILAHTCANAETLAEEEDYIAHIYALYMLAQFKEQKAYPLIFSLLNKPDEILDKLLGDVITEGLPSILASVFDGDVKLLKSIIENDKINEFIRAAAFESLVILVSEGVIKRDEVVEYCLYLFRGGLGREYSYTWDALVGCCYNLYPEETLKDIELAYDEELVDPTSISFSEIIEQLGKSKQIVLEELHNDSNYKFIGDTIRELEDWLCFDQRVPALPLAENTNFKHASIDTAIREPYRIESKIGRNDPCPCGSGKKHKKCCGQN